MLRKLWGSSLLCHHCPEGHCSPPSLLAFPLGHGQEETQKNWRSRVSANSRDNSRPQIELLILKKNELKVGGERKKGRAWLHGHTWLHRHTWLHGGFGGAGVLSWRE